MGNYGWYTSVGLGWPLNLQKKGLFKKYHTWGRCCGIVVEMLPTMSASCIGTPSTPSCSTSDSTSCYLPGEHSRRWIKCWIMTIHKGDPDEAPDFSLSNPGHCIPAIWGVNKHMEDLSLPLWVWLSNKSIKLRLGERERERVRERACAISDWEVTETNGRVLGGHSTLDSLHIFSWGWIRVWPPGSWPLALGWLRARKTSWTADHDRRRRVEVRKVWLYETHGIRGLKNP